MTPAFHDNLADNGLVVLEYDERCDAIVLPPDVTVRRTSFVEVTGPTAPFVVYPEDVEKACCHAKNRRDRTKWGQQIALRRSHPLYRRFSGLARALKSGKPLKHSYEHEMMRMKRFASVGRDQF